MLSLLEVLISLRKTSILLLKAFLGPLAVTFPVALFVLDMQFLWVYADEFMGKGIEPWVILKLIFFASMQDCKPGSPPSDTGCEHHGTREFG